jgi:hypothetical protein
LNNWKHQSAIYSHRAGDGTRTHDLLLGKETFYQLNHARMSGHRQAENAESQNRTGDTVIFSHVLYQLSYLGLNAYAFVKAQIFYTGVRWLSSWR